jgi:hypothetical protein
MICFQKQGTSYASKSSARQSPTLVVPTSLTEPAESWTNVSYSLNSTGAAACRIALEALGVSSSADYRLLLRERGGRKR